MGISARSAFSGIYKLVFASIGIYGVFSGVSNSPYAASIVLSYYTLISNMICIAGFLIFGLWSLLGKNLNNRYYFAVKGGMVVMILLTFFVFHFMLAPSIRDHQINYNFDASFEKILHYIVPLSFLGDFILNDEKGNFKFSYAFFWVVVPMLYVPFVYIKIYFGGSFDMGMGSKYPYFFLDYEKLGITKVVFLTFGILLFFMTLSFSLIGLDKILSLLRRKTKTD